MYQIEVVRRRGDSRHIFSSEKPKVLSSFISSLNAVKTMDDTMSDLEFLKLFWKLLILTGWQLALNMYFTGAGVLWLYVYIGEYHGLYSKRGFSILKQSIIFTPRLIIDLLLQLKIIIVSTTGMCNTCPYRDPLFFSVSFLQSLMDCLRQLVELSTFYQYLFITKLGLTLLLPALLTFTVTSIVNREWSAAPLSIVRGHWSITKLSITLLWQIEWSFLKVWSLVALIHQT